MLLEKEYGFYVNDEDLSKKLAPSMSKELNDLNNKGARRQGVIQIT